MSLNQILARKSGRGPNWHGSAIRVFVGEAFLGPPSAFNYGPTVSVQCSIQNGKNSPP